MVKKHIKRDYSAHKKSVVRPMDEYIKLEIFSYNHINTELYSAYQNNLSMENANKITQYAWIGYESTDKTSITITQQQKIMNTVWTSST